LFAFILQKLDSEVRISGGSMQSRQQEKAHMKKIFAAFLFCGFLTACGGGGGGDKEYTFSDPQTPSAPEQAVADSAEAGIEAVVVGDVSTDSADGAMAIPYAGMSLFYTGGASGALGPVPSAGEILAAAKARLSRSNVIDDAYCPGTVTETSITWNNCTWSEVGYTVTIDGTISVEGNRVWWNLTWTMDMSMDTDTVSETLAYSGDITVTATTVVGWADLAFSTAGSGYDLGFTIHSAVDLTYQDEPFCVTDGTLEYQIAWTNLPQGADEYYHDAAILFDWSGCGVVTIAYSVE
jgi:hypothetical protein